MIGARLGGEVRAFQTLPHVTMAIGVDIEPGEKNEHVLYGDAHTLHQFKNASFGSAYCNVLDDVPWIDRFAAAAHRVLRPAGTLFIDLPHQSWEDTLAVNDLIADREKIVNQIKAAGFVELMQTDHRYSMKALGRRLGSQCSPWCLLHQYVFHRNEV